MDMECATASESSARTVWLHSLHLRQVEQELLHCKQALRHAEQRLDVEVAQREAVQDEVGPRSAARVRAPAVPNYCSLPLPARS